MINLTIKKSPFVITFIFYVLLVQISFFATSTYASSDIISELLEEIAGLKKIVPEGKKEYKSEDASIDGMFDVLKSTIEANRKQHTKGKIWKNFEPKNKHTNYKQHLNRKYPTTFDLRKAKKLINTDTKKNNCSCWVVIDDFGGSNSSPQQISTVGGMLCTQSTNDESESEHLSTCSIYNSFLPIRFWYMDYIEDCKHILENKKTLLCDDIINNCFVELYDKNNYYWASYATHSMPGNQIEQTIKQIKASIYTDGPAYFVFDFYDDFFIFWHNDALDKIYILQSYSDRVSKDSVFISLVIGWDDDKEAWLCKNIWPFEELGNNDTFLVSYKSHDKNLNFTMINAKKDINNNPKVELIMKFLNNTHEANITNMGSHELFEDTGKKTTIFQEYMISPTN